MYKFRHCVCVCVCVCARARVCVDQDGHLATSLCNCACSLTVWLQCPSNNVTCGDIEYFQIFTLILLGRIS